MLKKKKYLIGGVIVLLAVGFLLFQSFSANATYYLKVDEALAKGSSIYGKTVRVEGSILDGSVERQSAGRLLKFSMSDTGSASSLPVVYTGIVPDTFGADGTSAVVEGKLNPDGVFQASLLMTKCPSKYEPQQAAASTVTK